MKVLFILKERFYNNSTIKSFGLMNSASHVSNYIISKGIDSKVVMVVDANGIDKEVHDYKPDIVILEALWIPSSKLKELIEIKKYSKITWIVRIHSDMGFLSTEAMALKYINDYIELKKHNLIIAPNAEEFSEYLSEVLDFKFKYLPNIITIPEIHKHEPPTTPSNIINIGCFGALRILKNHVFQAICAIKAADLLNKELHFHINVDANHEESRINPDLKNLRELFTTSKHQLIEHLWMENDKFQELVKTMDIGLRLSYTESFNIVSSDFANNGIPIIVSDSIGWMPNILKTSTIKYKEVITKITHIYNSRFDKSLSNSMKRSLNRYNRKAEKIWINLIKN